MLNIDFGKLCEKLFIIINGKKVLVYNLLGFHWLKMLFLLQHNIIETVGNPSQKDSSYLVLHSDMCDDDPITLSNSTPWGMALA